HACLPSPRPYRPPVTVARRAAAAHAHRLVGCLVVTKWECRLSWLLHYFIWITLITSEIREVHLLAAIGELRVPHVYGERAVDTFSGRGVQVCVRKARRACAGSAGENVTPGER